MFIDKAKITIKSGKGGDGCIAFRHEKYIDKGGPSGGNGGKGGSIIFKATKEQYTLIKYRFGKKFVAKDGGKGMAKNMYGKGAEDVILDVPVGTIVRDLETNEILCDLSHDGDTYLALKGGRGGKGNACFASSRNRAPRIAENGELGKEKRVELELKLLADVALVGLPSVGKSTILSIVTKAKPEIADYPFTTLVPQLGVVYLDDDSSFVLADLPGLIEGASSGKGLGLTFLRHIERCRVLVHVLDMEHDDPINDYEVIMKELDAYKMNLLSRPMLIVCNKVEDDITKAKAENVKDILGKDHEVLFISAILHEGIDRMLYKMKDMLKEAPFFPINEQIIDATKIYDASKEQKYIISHPEAHRFVISGEYIENIYHRINTSTDEGIMHLLKILRELKVEDQLEKMGIVDGDEVSLCDFEFTYYS